MTDLTEEEREAMAIWQLREWGVHPSWIEYIQKSKLPYVHNLADAVDQHIQIYGELAGENVADYYKKPCGEGTYSDHAMEIIEGK